ncbi:MAG: hypothetical protein WC509_07710 [Candidatus Izemoplasmatales bacterium]
MRKHDHIAKFYNLYVDPHGAFGEIHEVEAAVTTEPSEHGETAVMSYLFRDPLTPEQTAGIDAVLSPEGIVPTYAREGTLLRFPLAYATFKAPEAERIDRILQALAEAIRALGIRQWDRCGLCEQEGFDTLRLMNGAAMKTHDACYDRLMAEVEAAWRKQNGGFRTLFKGYSWMAAGAFLGTLVNYFALVYGEVQISFLYALVPLFGLLMYRASKVPHRREYPFILTALSVLFAAGMITYVYGLYAQSWGMTLLAFLRDGIPDVPDMFSIYVGEVLYAVIFCIAAVAVTWRRIPRPHP